MHCHDCTENPSQHRVCFIQDTVYKVACEQIMWHCRNCYKCQGKWMFQSLCSLSATPCAAHFTVASKFYPLVYLLGKVVLMNVQNKPISPGWYELKKIVNTAYAPNPFKSIDYYYDTIEPANARAVLRLKNTINSVLIAIGIDGVANVWGTPPTHLSTPKSMYHQSCIGCFGSITCDGDLQVQI